MDDLIRDLESAEKYIFMEYFIVDKGYMWDTILEILKRKAAEGLDVRHFSILSSGMTLSTTVMTTCGTYLLARTAKSLMAA